MTRPADTAAMPPSSYEPEDWREANQRYLVAKLGVLSGLLMPGSVDETRARSALAEASAALPAPAALDVLALLFGLSPFESELLLLCAGVELDSAFAERCAAALGGAPRPTFGLALAVLPDAHWSALGPGSPLRRFQLLELGQGDTLTRSPLRINERVLHFLVGVNQPDERLMNLLEPAAPVSGLVPSHQRLVERLVGQWKHIRSTAGTMPVVGLSGGDPRTRRALAVSMGAALGLRLEVLAAGALAARSDGEQLGPLLARELQLGGGGLLLEVDEPDAADAARMGLAGRLVDLLPVPVFVSARHRLRLGRGPGVFLEVPRPTASEQRELWRQSLGAAGVEADDALLEPLVTGFGLDSPAIHSACAAALASEPGAALGTALWEACRAEARSGLEELAQRIEPAATWDDLVLPEGSRKVLRELVLSVRQRARVHGDWGFSTRGTRGLGVGALFAGPSGTGKTLAAEVLAAELRLDLYRIDLSQLVSKYIGDTEKNLRRVFDAAERGAALLLFDEADALFARRGEVRDSLDRYANLEVAYLLQRMEAYQGLAILTTNLEQSIDPAFLRRLRFVVRFPTPGMAERAELWRRAFPPQTPTEGLDFERLARMGLTGGNIRGIVLRAAYLAAEAGTPVRMEHVWEAARAEYEKLGRAPGNGEEG